MKFIALPVNVGDSFLLKDEHNIILVDGGMDRQHIVKLLNQEHIKHIDVLVCTHYDADHINGIIGILKSNKFTFKELWLPEILGSIGYTLSKKITELFKYLRNNKVIFDYFEYESIFKLQKEHKAYENEIIYNSKSNYSIENFEDIDIQVLNNFFDTFFWNPELLWSDNYYKMMLTLRSIVLLIRNSLCSGAYIRWFKYNEYTHRNYGFNLYSENAIQTDITIYEPEKFFLILYHLSLSNINKYSLVFMYDKDDLPNVLFSADSDLDFYSQPVKLKDNSIVTAPHHGSAHNNKAYDKILGNRLIFVRSDRSQLKRPGGGYLKQKRRYCTICRNWTPKQKVELIYDKTKSDFITNSKPCKCDKRLIFLI